MTSQLVTPAIGISWPFILLKECFDMLSSIGYGDFLKVFWSSRQYDRVYLGWFVFDLVWRLFTMQASRRSVKAHYSFRCIGSSLSTGFQVYLSKCWGPYVRPSYTICFFLQFFSLISASWSYHYLSKGYVPSLFSCEVSWWMESINLAGAMHEAGDADSRAGTKSQR